MDWYGPECFSNTSHTHTHAFIHTHRKLTVHKSIEQFSVGTFVTKLDSIFITYVNLINILEEKLTNLNDHNSDIQ